MAAEATQVQGPRVIYMAPSMLLPKGVTAPPQAAAPAQAATPQAAQAPAATGTAAHAGIAGPAQAKVGVLQRILGLLPVATGLAQAMIGFFITNGKISLAAVPLLGKMPAFLIGGLVAATAMPTLMQGIAKLLGKT